MIRPLWWCILNSKALKWSFICFPFTRNCPFPFHLPSPFPLISPYAEHPKHLTKYLSEYPWPPFDGILIWTTGLAGGAQITHRTEVGGDRGVTVSDISNDTFSSVKVQLLYIIHSLSISLEYSLYNLEYPVSIIRLSLRVPRVVLLIQ